MLPSNLVENCFPSAHPLSGRWQVSQDISPVFERRLSKNNCLPSATFSAVSGLSGGVGTGGRATRSRFTGVAAGAAGAAAFSAAGFSALFPHADTMSANTSTRLYACFVTAYPPAFYFAQIRSLLASYTLPTNPLEVINDPPTTHIRCMFGCISHDALNGMGTAIQSQPVWRNALAQHRAISRRTHSAHYRRSWSAERVLHRRS